MKMTSKGQVIIPANLRAVYGLLPHAELEFIESKEGLIIRKKEKENRRGKKLIHTYGWHIDSEDDD